LPSKVNQIASSFADLENFAQGHPGWLFRGHRSPSWKLEPSLERTAKRCGVGIIDYECQIFREFQRHAHSYVGRVPKELDTIEWLAFMQHYGAPTRLLDFTYSFWIALFFAFEDAESDCAVVALNPQSLAQNRPGLDYNKVVRDNIEQGANADDFLYANVPFYTNERLAIQKGTFVFSLNLARTFESLVQEKQKEYEQLTVAFSIFPEIRRKLNEFNCNSRVLFPGIDGYSRYFKNHTP
jgi:hypothetical protein